MSVLGGGDKRGKWWRTGTMNECWGKVCPRSFLLFLFSFFVLFSSNFLPIQAGGGRGGTGVLVEAMDGGSGCE